MRTAASVLGVLVVCAAASGCSGIGPPTIKAERIDYSSALGTSWKDQTLLNIVKFRYLDVPVFLDVASVVSSRELQTEANVKSAIFPKSALDNNVEANVIGRYADRPTISYSPLSGERLVKSQLRPIPQETVLAMIEAGHNAAFILQLAVRSINGVHNHASGPLGAARHSAFEPLSFAIYRVQLAQALNARIVRVKGHARTLISFQRGLSAGLDRDIRFIQRVLHLDPKRRDYVLTGGGTRAPGEIAMETRSLHEILADLSRGVEVPPEDVAGGRAMPAGPPAHADASVAPAMRARLLVRSGPTLPPDAYASAYYRGRWFWIDDRDLRSKGIFMFLLMFTSLAENSQAQMPVLTIPTR